MWIPLKNLSVAWVKSQRGLDQKRAKRIAEAFDPDLFGVLIVCPDGKGNYHIIEGQHRVAAARLMWGGEQKVPAEVLNVDNPKDAANLFYQLNTLPKRARTIELFKIAVEAGYQNECAVDAIIKECGFVASGSPGDGNIRAVTACSSVFKEYGRPTLEATLRMIKDVWGNDPVAVEGSIIRGMAMFLKVGGGLKMPWEKTVEKIQKNYTAGKVLASAKVIRDSFRGYSTAQAVSQVLQNAGKRSRGASRA